MSIKSKVLATAATLALVGGVGTAGVLGTAAPRTRPRRRAPAPASTSSARSSATIADSFILDVYQQRARIGQPIILYRASTNDLAEDFRAVVRARWPTSTRPGG